jgi:adenylate cyclase
MIIGGPPLVPSPSKAQEQPRPEARAVTAQLEKILASADFDASPRSRAFIRFIVDETLAGRQEALTQADIATRVFGRRDDFDPTVDPIVRIQAGRLRRSLERYYLLSGASDPVRIELPRGSYVPLLRWAPPHEKAAAERREALGRAPGAFDDWPSVNVCLFESVPRDIELEEGAVRLQEVVAVELGRYGDVRVVLRREPHRNRASPCEEARFALSGRIAREAGSVRITAHLLDCRGERQVWAEDYEARPGPALDFFEETARIIAGRLASEQGVVGQELWAEQRRQPPDHPTPYAAILRSYQYLFHRKAADLAPAIEALKQVVAEEPECGLAWTLLGRLYCSNFAFDVAPLETPIEDAVEFAQRGVRLNPSSQRARAVLAAAFLFRGELAIARTELQSALELNPESFVYLEWISWLMTVLGDWDAGPALARKAVGRNPHHNPVANLALWMDHLHRGEMEEAHRAAQQYADATFFWRPLMRACSLGQLGRASEAKAEVAELLRQKPDFATRGRTLIGRLIRFPDLFETVVDGLRKAGLELA